MIVALAHGAQFSRTLPESRGKPRQKRSSQARAFKHFGAIELGIKDIGLELHQKAVRRCPAVDVELVNLMPRFALHGRGDIGNLVRHGLERRPGDIRPVRAARKAENRAARLGVPIRRTEARERWNHYNARRIGDAVRKVFAFSSVLGNAEFVSLHHGTRYEHAALKGVFEPVGARSACGDRGYEAVLRFNGGMARME